MTKYELVLLTKTVRPMTSSFNTITSMRDTHKALLKECAKFVLDNQGVVRQFQNLGERDLPYRMKRHQQLFDYASYYTMTFDASPRTMIELQKQLKRNELVIRHTVINLGNSLQETTGYLPAENTH
ncbi:hypothetical protein EDD86DRAFT_209595 [Gorgonomyces haynaldii]|nr:hypothetical protein EDD86DRAFT_209595 [Gorgonomyces haynaldii]